MAMYFPVNDRDSLEKALDEIDQLETDLKADLEQRGVDELRAGAYALQAFSGYDYGKFNQANARNVSWETYQEYKNKLPAQWMKRCEHWYTECRRVQAGAEAWRKGDIEEYGRLSFESGVLSSFELLLARNSSASTLSSLRR